MRIKWNIHPNLSAAFLAAFIFRYLTMFLNLWCCIMMNFCCDLSMQGRHKTLTLTLKSLSSSHPCPRGHISSAFMQTSLALLTPLKLLSNCTDAVSHCDLQFYRLMIKGTKKPYCQTADDNFNWYLPICFSQVNPTLFSPFTTYLASFKTE